MQVPKKIKILQLDTFYHSYLGSIYTRDVSLRSKSYSGQMQTILQDGFAAVHTVAPYMEELGYEIMWVIGNSYYSQLKWAEEHMPGIHIDQSMMSEIIRHQIEIFQPDVLYTTDPVFFDSKLIKTFKKKPELVIGYLASDIPPQTDWSEFDLILSPLSSLRKEALKIGARESAYFKPGGFPLWIYDEIKIIVPEYNTTFIGQWTNGQHKNRNRLIEILAANAEASLRKDALGLFLSGEVDSIPPAVRKYNVGSKFGLEMYKSLRSGKIAFDARGDIRALKTTMEIADLAANETANMRIFEATGCGVFLLTEYRENLHEYFEIGKEIETFSSESELIDKINYYSTNATAREKIALQGKIRCHSYHSMYQKTRELDNLVKERLSSFKNTKTNHNAMNTINQKEFSVQPVSRLFGFDRGNPIDRYYIEKFLQNNRRDIKGTVVEIAENTYTKRFGNNVTESLILSYTKAPNVDIVGDFATGENIPKSRFDCIILTQTIQFIYDVKSALLNAYNSLRDGGTLLLTASGISQISRYDMDRWGEFWRFTDRTFEALIKDVIPSAEFEIDTFGNVAVAKAFLDGLAYEEIPQDVLDYKDPDYQVLLSVKIKKNSNVTHGYKELLKKEHPHKENAPVHKQPAKQADAYEANVLLYHRIANDPLDTQLLTVTPENFDEHLKVLKNNFNIVPLSSLIRSVKEKSIEPRTIAITFDDGYLDN
ncbi:MAG: glycosyltransferase, partial [Ignavibacteriales bacterium]